MLKKAKTLAILTGLFLSSSFSFANVEALFAATTKDAVLEALQDGTDVNSLQNEETALYVAAKNGYPEVVWVLLLKGADPALKAKGSCTPFMESAATSMSRFFERVKASFKGENAETQLELRRKHHKVQKCMAILMKWPFMTQAQKEAKQKELGMEIKI